MFQLKDISRKQAFLSHLGISLIIFAIVLYFIIFHWYPQPFFTIDGGWQGIRLIAGVDIVLGPLLTLIVFKPGKKGLKTDLTLIAIIQFSALVSGIYVVQNERAVAKVFQDGILNIVTGYDMRERNISNEDLEQYRIADAITIYLDLPDDNVQFSKLKIDSLKKQEPLYLSTSLYKKIDSDVLKKMRLFSIDVERYIKDKYSDRELKLFHAFLKKHNASNKDFLFLAIKARFKYGIVALNPDTFEFVGVLPAIKLPPEDIFNNYIKYDIFRQESYKKYLLEKIKKEETPKNKARK